MPNEGDTVPPAVALNDAIACVERSTATWRTNRVMELLQVEHLALTQCVLTAVREAA